MPRTDADLVSKLLAKDYRPGADLDAHILTASVLVDRVADAGMAAGAQVPDPLLELIERWLAAHAYCMVDQPYSSKSTEGSSGSFQGQTGKYYEATKYGQMAVSLDSTGTLAETGGGGGKGGGGEGVAQPAAYWLGGR
jgi:hypothetical protein